MRCSPLRRNRDEGRACGACGLWQVQLFLPHLEPIMASGREWEMRLQKGRLRGKEAEGSRAPREKALLWARSDSLAPVESILSGG